MSAIVRNTAEPSSERSSKPRATMRVLGSSNTGTGQADFRWMKGRDEQRPEIQYSRGTTATPRRPAWWRTFSANPANRWDQSEDRFGVHIARVANRSEERRVGKECRSRWSPSHERKKRVKLRRVLTRRKRATRLLHTTGRTCA